MLALAKFKVSSKSTWKKMLTLRRNIRLTIHASLLLHWATLKLAWEILRPGPPWWCLCSHISWERTGSCIPLHQRAASPKSHYLPSSTVLERRKGWQVPYLLQKKHHLPWSLGPGQRQWVANPKLHRFPTFCFTKASAHWQEYLSLLRQTPAQCAWFDQEPLNSTVSPAEWKETMKMHDQRLNSYNKIAISRISSPELWNIFWHTSSTSHSRDRAVGIHSKMP